MAINVQVKGDKKFNDSFTATDCCNSSYVNDVFGQRGQAWATPMDTINVTPACTTTMPDGLYGQSFIGSQIPASLVSLYGANTTLPFGYQGFTPAAAGLNGPVAYANTNTVPFGGFANPMNTLGQIASATPAMNAFGTTANPYMNSTTTPWSTDFFGSGFTGTSAPMIDAVAQTVASDIATTLITGFGVSPIVASQIASTAITSPIAAASIAAQYGVSPTILLQLAVKSILATLSGTAHGVTASSLTKANTESSTPWSASATQQQSMLNASMMPVDIYETEDDYVLLSDMPGASIEDINILVEGQMLVIKGVIKPASWDKLGMGSSAVAVLQEKPAVKNFQRVFPISSNVLTDKLTAKLTEGILTVKLPKAKTGFGSTRRVAVAVA
jgi:HSP20 family molecular chaperone IbpA